MASSSSTKPNVSTYKPRALGPIERHGGSHLDFHTSVGVGSGRRRMKETRLMPSSQTSIPKLDKKIGELEAMAQDGHLSPANSRMLEMYQRWRNMAGKDVCLVIVPKPAYASRKAVPRVVEVSDMLAADILTHAPLRGDLVRLATVEEEKAWRAYELSLGKRAKATAAKVAQDAARALLAQTLGTAPEYADLGDIPPPPTPGGVVDTSKDEAEAMIPEIPSLDGDGDPGGVPLSDATGTDNSELLASIPALKDSVAAAVVAAGFLTVEQLAEAQPKDLEKVNGVGPALASQIIVAASEAVAE